MKQDSYARFLKSELYKTHLMAEMESKLPTSRTAVFTAVVMLHSKTGKDADKKKVSLMSFLGLFHNLYVTKLRKPCVVAIDNRLRDQSFHTHKQFAASVSRDSYSALVLVMLQLEFNSSNVKYPSAINVTLRHFWKWFVVCSKSSVTKFLLQYTPCHSINFENNDELY